MLGKTYEAMAKVCSAARALEVVGERWSLLIIRDALYADATRFSDFRRLGIATNILKARLDGFVEAGIMERRPSPGKPESFHYVLTDKGRDLAPVIATLTEWGDRWEAPDGPPLLYVHSTCGGAVRQQTACENCGPVPDPEEIQTHPGPGLPADAVL
ncbi:helix-turn-helix domain-containing protein [Asanoa sp. NPDC050611]|uniref:winged helix-turn-helix transcriptional regulator n=1 Tax=Asanoa sp. NPDC050611 TaxID=3157098 RepID=UPI0033F80B4D